MKQRQVGGGGQRERGRWTSKRNSAREYVLRERERERERNREIKNMSKAKG